MDSGLLIRTARARAGLSLRQLADLAGTSHPTLTAYEHGRKVPRVDTLERIATAAGFVAEVRLQPRPDRGDADRVAKGRELVEVLELAAAFPAEPARTLQAPVFRRR